jgi:predicted DNA-binding transcriptional regulator AlpA
MTTRARQPIVLDDGFLSLDELATYSGLSRRTLEDYLKDLVFPLPHYRMAGRVLVKRSEYDKWAEFFRFRGDPVDIKARVDAELKER